MNGAADPLIVTLRCNGPRWGFCIQQRELHFPPERNLVPAHIALFHHLPGEALEQILADVEAARIPSFEFQVSGVRSLGRGVAYVVDSPPLTALREELAGKWRPWLTPQDCSKYSPHITIQNKVEPQQARELLQALQSDFSPFPLKSPGLEIWHYRGGPWEPAGYVPFLVS